MIKIKASSYQSIPRQSVRLGERHKQEPFDVDCCGIQIRINTGVYATSGDSELMIETAKISPNETFLEIGCGTGVVSIALSKRSNSGVGVDINDFAVENSKFNAEKHSAKNIKFFKSNVFENVNGKFDVIVCNPPYTNHAVSDDIDRMYWDPNDETKRIFFKDVSNFLKENGRIYFGWADFGDIDVDLPLKLAEESGFVLVQITEKQHANKFTFLVFEFYKINN
jgi:release factor glutamine methyltransferase